MHLLLWRHAEAEDAKDTSQAADLQRPLTNQGHQAARRIGKWLSTHQPEALVVRVSPARRCQETAAHFFKFSPLPHMTHDGIAPNTSVSALLDASGWAEAYSATFPQSAADTDAISTNAVSAPMVLPNVLLVSHQPYLGALISLLLTGQANRLSLRKGALCWLEFRQRDGVAKIILRRLINPEDLYPEV